MIIAIEGYIGTGKTLTLATLGLNDLYKGKRLYSNVKYKNLTKEQRKRITYLDKDSMNNIFEMIKTGRFDMKNSTVLIQEAHNYMDSRTSMSKKNTVIDRE